MGIVMMSNHIVPSGVSLSTPRHRTDVVLVPIMVRHVSIQVLLPKETPSTLITLERSVVGSRVAFFMVSISY
jgi:hypothetical protein